MRIFLFTLVIVLLCSCTFAPTYKVSVAPYHDTPWEEESGRPMWYKVRWFDGKEVHSSYLDSGEWTIEAKVYPGSLAVFAFYPLGEMEPLGGFWESGSNSKVWLRAEDGYFASMLLDAAEEIPEAVGAISVENLREKVQDLSAINRNTFLSLIYSGTIDKKEIELSKKYDVPLDGVLRGRWLSLFSKDKTIYITNTVEKESVSLFPGIWHFLCLERKLMLTITLDDEGHYWTRLSPSPEW